jgi:lipopolysaccharide transport system ATP-binding protein
MSSRPAIAARGLSKCYHLYERPADRLKQMLWRGRRRWFREFWALRGVDLVVQPGEVVGVVGRNGAGKSTLLQLVCGTVTPTSGSVAVDGRVSALLELGAGFHAEFSGRENVYLAAALQGLTREEIDERYEAIVDFSGVREFIDQPVKTYSSGMFVRLAFAVATSLDPDVVVIDEALSVGDGEFARKSFDRIMALRDAGAAILFCSHSMYQVEALCSRALWLARGEVKMLDSASAVASAYGAALTSEMRGAAAAGGAPAAAPAAGTGRILGVMASADGLSGTTLPIASQKSTLAVTVEFAIDPSLPPPSVALGIADAAGTTVASVATHFDGVRTSVAPDGRGRATVVFPKLPLLKGRYSITSFLGCENGIHVYDFAERSVQLIVEQDSLAQGVVALPHEWARSP